jgi:hypothetical protein
MRGERTDEDLSLTDPDARARRFGQSDHVRQYGRDFIARLDNAGFRVLELQREAFLSADQVDRLALGGETSSLFVFKRS